MEDCSGGSCGSRKGPLTYRSYAALTTRAVIRRGPKYTANISGISVVRVV